MKRFPIEILFELYSANLARHSYNYIGYKKQSWLFFCLIFTRLLPSQTYIKAHINVHSLAPTFCIHLQKYFFFFNLTLIRKYVGNNSWQDLTGVCFIFTFYTLTCSGSNLVLLLFHLSCIESCRHIDKDLD